MLVLPEQNMSYVACINDQPVAAFGFSPITVACVSVWAFGTDRMSRVVPAITDFITLRAAPGLISAGFRTMEARSITSHKEAHRWMESMGGLRTGPSFMYGKNDERFYLYRWTAKHYDDIRKMKQRWKRSDHVLCAETTEDARSPGSARAAQA